MRAEKHGGGSCPARLPHMSPFRSPTCGSRTAEDPAPRPSPRPARTPGPTLGAGPRTAPSGLASILPHGPRSGPFLWQFPDLHVPVPFLYLASSRPRSTGLE